MYKRVTYVFKLCDSCFGSIVKACDVQIYVDGIRTTFVYKTGGYFVLSDMQEGNYSIELRSWMYQTEQIDITVDYGVNFSDESNVRYCFLNPSRKHPGIVSMPFVSGVLPDGVGELYIVRKKGELKIAEDSAEAQKNEVKLFCGPNKPVIPSTYLISDKSADKNEFVVLKGVSGDTYTLSSPLKNTHTRSTPLMPLIRIKTDKNGGFFFILPQNFHTDIKTGAISFSLLYEKNRKLKSAVFTANEKGETNLGEI